MILTEDLIIDNKEFVRHYTDSPIYDKEGNELPKLIQVETGYEFIDAIDLKPCKFTYIEKEESKSELNSEGSEEVAPVEIIEPEVVEDLKYDA